jgi:hypothetical protein
MSKYLIPFCLLVILSLCTKEQTDNDILHLNKELLAYLRDSTNVLIEANELEVNGYIDGDSMQVRYFSVSPDEYYMAFEESDDYIRMFMRSSRRNEILGDQVHRYNEDKLTIEANGNYYIFEDNETEHRGYYYVGKLGDSIHIIMSYRFEDMLTYYLNSRTGELREVLSYGSLTTHQNDRLIFYSEFPIPIYSKDYTEITLSQINSERIDTLISEKTDWFAENAFFKKPDKIYYIHSVIDSNLVLQSSYAKMEIYWK